MVRDVDGDTIVAHVGGRDEPVRLLGIDTPETKDPRKPVQCYGHEASSHTRPCCHRAPRCGSRATSRRAIATVACCSTCGARATGCSSTASSPPTATPSLLTFPPNTAHEPELAAAVDRGPSVPVGAVGPLRRTGQRAGPSG